MRSSAGWLFLIAALSMVNSVVDLTGGTWHFFIGLGLMDAANAFGELVIKGTSGAVMALIFDAGLAAGIVVVAMLARRGASWAFMLGMVVYGLDALLFVWARDWLSVVFHGLALFYLFRGYRASRLIAGSARVSVVYPGMAPPIHPR